jgi:hypothetical protein
MDESETASFDRPSEIEQAVLSNDLFSLTPDAL